VISLILQDRSLVVVVAGSKVKVTGLWSFQKMKVECADTREMRSSLEDMTKTGFFEKGSLVDHVILMMVEDFQMTDVRRQSGNMKTHFIQLSGFYFY